MNYNGGSLKLILLNEENNGAIVVSGGYLYMQQKSKTILEERNISTGLVNRNIVLPRPFSVLNDLAIIEKSQHSRGKIFTMYKLIS